MTSSAANGMAIASSPTWSNSPILGAGILQVERTRRTSIVIWLFGIALVYGVSFLAGVAYGLFADQLERSTWPSNEQASVLRTMGDPGSWIVADDRQRRFERWVYPEEKVAIEFVDGLLIKWASVDDASIVSGSNRAPVLFDRWMSRDTVETILGEQGELVVEFTDDDGYRAWLYPKAGLLVLYCEDRFRGGMTL